MKKLRMIIAAAFMLAAGGAPALTNTWTGTTDTNWNTAANWGGTALAANSGLNFTGTANTNTYNNTTANTSYANMLFGNTGNGQGFVLSGNQITLGGNITTAVAVASANITDVINLNMQMNLARKVTLGTRHNLTINGVISQSGIRDFTLATVGSGGTLTLTGNNSFTGVLGNEGNGSVLSISSIANSGVNSAAGAGSLIRLGNAGNTAGVLEYTGGAASVDRQIQVGNGLANNTYTSGAVIKNNGTGALRFTNQTFNSYQAGSTIANRTLTLGGINTASNEISGKITNNKFDGTNFNSTTGTIALVKADAGTWILSGANTYSGITTVSNGTLAINGDMSGATGTVTVDAGATLMGNGIIGGATTVNGNLKPGNSPGTLTFNAALTLGSASTSTFEIVSASVYDVLKNDGNDTITFNTGANIIFDFTSWTGGNATNGTTFALLENWGNSSTFTNGPNYTYVNQANLGLTGSQSLQMTSTGLTVIPEPATIGMLGLGALVTLMIRRMRTA